MSEAFCEWTRSFDDHFNISCVNETHERANGHFKPDKTFQNTKWNFTFCPYCGKKIKVYSPRQRKTSKKEGE
jgi:hypothetical protein